MLKTRTEVPRPASPTKKRKKPDEDIIPVPGMSKKAKQDNSSKVDVLRPGNIDTEFSFPHIGEAGK